MKLSEIILFFISKFDRQNQIIARNKSQQVQTEAPFFKIYLFHNQNQSILDALMHSVNLTPILFVETACRKHCRLQQPPVERGNLAESKDSLDDRFDRDFWYASRTDCHRLNTLKLGNRTLCFYF
jgi:hypothetical protein